jgi:hypothetical protein
MLFLGVLLFAVAAGLVCYGIAIDEVTCPHCSLPITEWDGCQNQNCKVNRKD